MKNSSFQMLFNRSIKTYYLARIVEFVEPLTDQLVEEGCQVTFSCVLNFDDVSVTWYKNGLKLQQSRDIAITSNGTRHKITFEKVDLNDQCIISLRAENLQVRAMISGMNNLELALLL